MQTINREPNTDAANQYVVQFYDLLTKTWRPRRQTVGANLGLDFEDKGVAIASARRWYLSCDNPRPQYRVLEPATGKVFWSSDSVPDLAVPTTVPETIEETTMQTSTVNPFADEKPVQPTAIPVQEKETEMQTETDSAVQVRFRKGSSKSLVAVPVGFTVLKDESGKVKYDTNGLAQVYDAELYRVNLETGRRMPGRPLKANGAALATSNGTAPAPVSSAPVEPEKAVPAAEKVAENSLSPVVTCAALFSAMPTEANFADLIRAAVSLLGSNPAPAIAEIIAEAPVVPAVPTFDAQEVTDEIKSHLNDKIGTLGVVLADDSFVLAFYSRKGIADEVSFPYCAPAADLKSILASFGFQYDGQDEQEFLFVR